MFQIGSHSQKKIVPKNHTPVTKVVFVLVFVEKENLRYFTQTLVARVALLVGIRGDRSTTTCFQCMQHKSALKLRNKFAQTPAGNSHLRERYIWRPSVGRRKKKFAALCGLVVGHFWLYCVIRLPIPLLPSPRLLLMGMLAKLETAPEIASAFFPNSIFTSDIGSLQNVAIDLI